MDSILHGDCLEIMRDMPKASVDSIVTDPPYLLKFMGKRWDDPGSFVERRPDRSVKFDQQAGNHNACNPQDAVRTRLVEGRRAQLFHEAWATEALRVLKPGGHLAAFGGARTYHRLACAVEDAGFEIRDQIMWLYGSGMNKAGYVRDRSTGGIVREGWAGSLKPCHEPIVLARKPLAERTVAAQVLATGTGALNVDGCRVGVPEDKRAAGSKTYAAGKLAGGMNGAGTLQNAPHDGLGRWPPNLCHDGSDEVMEAFVGTGTSTTGKRSERSRSAAVSGTSWGVDNHRSTEYPGDTGTAARFFPALGFSEDELRFMYQAKASRVERAGSKHPTIKPVALMRWLCRLVTPPAGTILDPFAGTGTTGEAAWLEGFKAILIERDAESVADIRARRERIPASDLFGARR